MQSVRKGAQKKAQQKADCLCTDAVEERLHGERIDADRLRGGEQAGQRHAAGGGQKEGVGASAVPCDFAMRLDLRI